MTTILEVALAPHRTTDPVAALLPAQPGEVLFGVAKRVHDSACAADQNLGHLEEELLRSGHEVFRQILEKAARQQGQRAQQQRAQLDKKMSTPEGRNQQERDLQLQLPLEPFTRVIELEAWNIREREDWGQSAALRGQGREPSRWHWTYGGTCFRLNQRGQSTAGRPLILNCGYVMTRDGVEALKEQLWAEAMRRGLGGANEVLIVGDGAVWIWSLAGDRLRGARQPVDFYHVSQHLWAVAHHAASRRPRRRARLG